MISRAGMDNQVSKPGMKKMAKKSTRKSTPAIGGFASAPTGLKSGGRVKCRDGCATRGRTKGTMR